MILERYRIHDFQTDPTQQPKISIMVPDECKFLDVTILPDGIYAWYEITVPHDKDGVHTESFCIAHKGKTIAYGTRFIRFLEMVIPAQGERPEALIVFPVYKYD